MQAPAIEMPQEELAAFCRGHHIRRLALFGSVLSGSFGPESDVDFLVEFEPGKTPGLIGLAQMELELSEKIGRKADLRTAEDLSRYFREEVVRNAQTAYAA